MKTKLKVDKDALQSAIQAVESKQTFSNRQTLADAVADTEWAKKHQPKPITSSVVLLRIKEFNLSLKTPKGKRGRQGSISSQQKDLMQSGRKKVKTRILTELRKIVPLKKLKLVEKAEKGSLKSLLILKCGECSDWQNQEIKNCTVVSCPLHTIRPYQ